MIPRLCFSMRIPSGFPSPSKRFQRAYEGYIPSLAARRVSGPLMQLLAVALMLIMIGFASITFSVKLVIGPQSSSASASEADN